MIMRNKNISLIIASLGLAMMLVCICGIYTVRTNNDLMLAVIGFVLSGMIASVAIWDYDYLTKQK
jgi:ABC-type enterochelin transport system permease subunit